MPTWMMRAVALVVAALLAAAAGVPRAAAQSARRVFRVGVLNEAFAANHPAVEGLRAGLKDLGFAEGRDVVLDMRFTEGDLQALPAAAKALVEGGADLVFCAGAPAIRAVRGVTRTLPIVFSERGDAVAAGSATAPDRPRTRPASPCRASS